MEIISSGQTFVLKRVYPVAWFGLLGVIALVAVAGMRQPQDALFLLAPLAFAVLGYFLMRKVWDFADEVRDGGSFLLVRRGDIEVRIPLRDVTSVHASLLTKPPYLTLRLRKPGKLGQEIVFVPRQKSLLNPLACDELTNDLTTRVADMHRLGART